MTATKTSRRSPEKLLARARCIACGSGETRPIMIISQDGVWPADPGHELVYDHDILARCGACGAAHIERWSHDCFSWSEPHDLWAWYTMEAADSARLLAAASACERPLDEDCRCPVHVALRESFRDLPFRLGREYWERCGPVYWTEAAHNVRAACVRVENGVPRLELGNPGDASLETGAS